MKNFIERWKNHGYERGESQKFCKKIIPTFAGIFYFVEKFFTSRSVPVRRLRHFQL